MAIYRNVRISFWTDSKIIDEFTPEDKYFYLYLFTNPHTNLSGCYELSIKQASVELGYDVTAIKTLINRFQNIHEVVRYSEKTKELLILNWHKYNWTSSEKFRKPLKEEICQIKDLDFKNYLMKIFNNDTVSIPYQYGTDTTVSVADTDVDTVTDMNELLTVEEIHKLYEKYENAHDLIEQVQEEINQKHIKIKTSAFAYINGYAKNKGWGTK